MIRRERKQSFKMGKEMVEYSIIIAIKSRMRVVGDDSGRAACFGTNPQRLLFYYFKYFTEKPLNGNRSSFFLPTLEPER